MRTDLIELFEDYTEKAAELLKQANAGDAEAQYKFATYLLREPDHTPRSGLTQEEINRALSYIQKSAAQGYCHGLAACDMGDIYFRNKFLPQDLKKARMWYNTALLKGMPIAAYMLGEFCYNGYDCEIDYGKAAEYYLRAIKGYISALVRFGDMFLLGQFFNADPELARRLYEYVVDEEVRFFGKHGIYSDAHGEALQRLDEMDRNADLHKAGASTESEAQLAARNGVIKILEAKEAKLYGDRDEKDDED